MESIAQAIKKTLDITKRRDSKPLFKIRLPGKIILGLEERGSPYPADITLLIMEFYKLNKKTDIQYEK